ncbi:sugar transferase [Candidatus Methylopumilus planktonicus]|uniref:sugar transferase n=1 Tax=Candidatus Methylopumilus planktonicus TaxID=1581557 RepID=UPI003BEEBA6C
MLKRLFDIFISLFFCVVLLPLILIVLVLVFINMGWPIIFTQLRPGKNGRPFKIYKFRTMSNQTDLSGNLLSDEQRLTKFGAFLRSTSCDELPALWNVLKGEMSLVGPRPLLMEYLPLYNKEQARRHDVKPGLTGWAQINGRNSISWEEKFELDVWYVDNPSFILDIKILFLTIKAVLSSKGVNASDKVTMKKFFKKINSNE